MEKIKNELSDSEWKIMMLLWDNEMSAREIEDALKGETGWIRNTIFSFLNRMIKKGYVNLSQDRPVRKYAANISKSDCVYAQSKKFLYTFFNGDLGLLVNTFTQKGELDEQEIRELINILEKCKH